MISTFSSLSSCYTIFWYMDMNLFAKIAEFERLCYQLSKRAQNSSWRINPENGQMENKIPPASLSGPTPRFSVPGKKAPNMTVDPLQSKMVSEPNMSNPQAKPAPVQPGAHAPVKPGTSAPAPAKPNAAPAKPSRQPAPWLSGYMGQDKEQQKANQTLEQQQESNKAQLNSGPSVGNKTPGKAPAPTPAPGKAKIDFDINPGNVAGPRLDPVKPFNGTSHRN